jgi:hypothetical protein
MTQDFATDAVDLLNDVLGDMLTSTCALAEYNARLRRGEFTNEQFIGAQRMCLSVLVLACAKLTEVWENYHSIFVGGTKAELKRVVADLQRRKVLDFRNKVVGHTWCRKLKRPLRASEVAKILDEICNGDAAAFLQHVNDRTINVYPSTIVSVVEQARNELAAMYSIRAADILER